MRPSEEPGIRRWRVGARSRARNARSTGDLEDLRRLVVGPEQERLSQLEGRPVLTGDSVASVLPEATAKAIQFKERELTVSLEPVLTAAMRNFARNEPALFGEILAPTIGAAVKRAVADALAALMERFNEALERSLSIQSLQWRLEAVRTGMTFAEVVLLRTMVYQVEQVFMIHPATGLVLSHVKSPGVGVQEPDQVASMLEAIDAYVREAFRAEPTAAHLSQIQVGDVTVWVDRSPSVVVAAVVRGSPPRLFVELLRETRDRLYLTYPTELARFQSDVSPFESARPILDQCLRLERRPAPRRAQYWLLTTAALVVIAAAVLLTRATEERRLLSAYAQALEAVPGIALTSVEKTGKQVRISGFRDPLSEPSSAVLAQGGLPPADLHWEPFYSLEPPLVEARVRHALQPPPGTTLSMTDGALRAEGTAPRLWVEQARLLSRSIPGVETYDEHMLFSQEDVEAFRTAVVALEEIEIPFNVGSAVTSTNTSIQDAVTHARQVVATAERLGMTVCIVVTGHADPTGSPEANETLSERRAGHVTTALRDRGVSDEYLRPVGGGIRRETSDLQRARSAILRVQVGGRSGVGGKGCSEVP